MATDYQQIVSESRSKAEERLNQALKLLAATSYSERTHFLYELLQNAEDAIGRRLRIDPEGKFPRTVSFRLCRDRLEFRHFGKLFDEADD